MQSLVARRFDVAVNDGFSGLLVIRRLKLARSAVNGSAYGRGAIVAPPLRAAGGISLSPALEHIPLYHFLHERHRELLPRIEKVVREMQASGELERVRQQAMAKMLKDAER